MDTWRRSLSRLGMEVNSVFKNPPIIETPSAHSLDKPPSVSRQRGQNLVLPEILRMVAQFCDPQTRRHLLRCCRRLYALAPELLFAFLTIGSLQQLRAFARQVEEAALGHPSAYNHQHPLSYLRHFELQPAIIFQLPYVGEVLPLLRSIPRKTSNGELLFPNLRSAAFLFLFTIPHSSISQVLGISGASMSAFTRPTMDGHCFLESVEHLHLHVGGTASGLSLPINYIGLHNIKQVTVAHLPWSFLYEETASLLQHQARLKDVTVDLEHLSVKPRPMGALPNDPAFDFAHENWLKACLCHRILLGFMVLRVNALHQIQTLTICMGGSEQIIPLLRNLLRQAEGPYDAWLHRVYWRDTSTSRVALLDTVNQ